MKDPDLKLVPSLQDTEDPEEVVKAQAAKEAAEKQQRKEIQAKLDRLVPRNRQGGVLENDGMIEFGGGQFRVVSFGSKVLQLECLPGTSIVQVTKGKRKPVAIIQARPPAPVDPEPIREEADRLIELAAEATQS